ncbi:MAG: hypothetical protein Fur0041_13850 [Bacteroidia bacterium]
MNQAVKTGIITGIVMVTLEYLVMIVPHGAATAIMQYGSRIAFVAGVYLSIKFTRDKELEGQLPFKSGLKAGVGAALISGIIFSIYSFISWTHLDMDAYLAEMRNANLQNKEILIALGNFTNANMMKGAAFLAITNVIIGFFISIAASLILRKTGGLLNQN